MSATSSCPVSLWRFDPTAHAAHPLHGAGRTYHETNCYADVLIELLHARGDEPLAALGYLVRTDWEGDQFTYYKPSAADLEALFGIDVHEMLPYKPIDEHIEDQLALGHTVLVEIDAWYLPDTAATSYRREHLKTTVAPEAIDREAQRLRYFHNAGFFELEGDDYRGAFRVGDGWGEDVLPPFIELVRFDAGPRLSGAELRGAARDRLVHHFARRPDTNPFPRFGARLECDLPDLLAGDAETYHAYAFVTVRMVGSAFELCADHVEWVLGDEAQAAVTALHRIVEASKVLSFRLARRRTFDPAPVVGTLAEAWEEAMAALRPVLT